MPFVEIVASADIVITKAGYGIITEVAAAGVPALFIRRDD
jgi:UDP-N-acetylglucosamine:LPS N-acetylglucosamine transferase